MPLDPYFSSTPPKKDKRLSAVEHFKKQSRIDGCRLVAKLFAKRSSGQELTLDDKAILACYSFKSDYYHNRNARRQHCMLRRQQSSGFPMAISRTFNTHKG